MGSVTESEWDEQEQAVMLGLAAYKASLCPLCGMPVEVCTAIENDGRFVVDGALRCHKSTALAVASSKLAADHPYKEALMFGARLKPAT